MMLVDTVLTAMSWLHETLTLRVHAQSHTTTTDTVQCTSKKAVVTEGCM